MPIIEIEGKGRVEVEDSFFDLSPEQQALQVDEISAALGEADTPIDPDLSAMDASGETVTLSKQVPEPHERRTVGPDEDFQAGLINETKAAYTDENGVSYSAEGVPLNDFRTETREVKPSEALKDIQNKEGKVTSRAYDGLSYGDALKVYETLANHPDAETDGNAIFLHGSRVPVPEPEFFGDGAKVSSVQLGGDGILQAASNLYDSLIAAPANKVLAAVGAEESIPLIQRQGIEKEGIIDSLQAEGPVLAAAGFTGLRAANAVVGGTAAATRGAMGEIQIAEGLLGKVLGAQNKFVEAGTKAAVRGTGINAATVATQNADDSGVFVGDEAAIDSPVAKNLVEVLSTDGRTRSGEILAKKVNLFSDSIATGLAASGLATSATGVKKLLYDNIFKGIFGLASESQQRNAVATELINAFGDVGLDVTPQEQRAIAERMSNIFQANREVILDSPGGQINVDLDPMAALANALEGSGNKTDQLEGLRARTVRNDVFSSGLAEPEAKQLEYGESVGKLQDDLYEAGGREGGVESARSGIVQAGRDEVSAARGVADSAQADVDKNASRIEQIFRMDATVGQKLAALEKDGSIDLNVYRKANESSEQVYKRITKGEETLRKARDTAYKNLEDNLPDDATFNSTETFNNAFEDAKAYIRPSVVKAVEDMDVDSYKFIRTKLLPAVNTAIKNTDEGSGPYQALMALKDDIQITQLDSLDDTTKALIQDNLDEVKRANQNYYNYFQEGPLRDVSDSQRGVNMLEKGGTNKNRSAELTQADRSSNIVDSLFDNSNRGKLQLVGEFLQTPEGGKSVKPLVDIGIAKVVQNSRKAAQTGGIGEIDSQQLLSGLSGFAATLEKISPKQYDRLQQILNEIRKHERNGVELERIAKEANEAADAVDKQVLDKELKSFFDGTGPTRVERSEGQEVFESIFKDKYNSTNKVRQIVDRARQAGDSAIRGVKAAFAKSLNFTAQTTEAQGKEVEKFLKNAEIIYEDQPQIVESLDTAFKLIKGTAVSNENRLGLKNIGSRQESAGILGAKRLTRLIFGVLNPTATTINTLVDISGKAISPKNKMIQLMAHTLSDGDEFIKIMDEFVKSGTVDDPRRLFNFMVKAGVYSNTDEEFAKFDEALQAEQANQGREPVDDTEDALR